MISDGEIHGSVIITWPRPYAGLYATPGAPLVCDGIRVCDAETGEEFSDGVRLTIDLGTPTSWTPERPITAEVTRIVMNDPSMLASHTWPCDAATKETADDAQCGKCGITWGRYEAWRANGGVSYSTFRYLVTEMRIAEA